MGMLLLSSVSKDSSVCSVSSLLETVKPLEAILLNLHTPVRKIAARREDLL